MVMGSYKRDRVALNHEWLWKGVNRDRDNEQRSHLLQSVRDLLLAGNYKEGNYAAGRRSAAAAMTPWPGYRSNRVDPYVPAGDYILSLIMVLYIATGENST